MPGRHIEADSHPQRTGLKLGPERAVEYLKFFCFFLCGAEGPFYVIPADGSHSFVAYKDSRPLAWPLVAALWRTVVLAR
jgi:hypothetical protein